MVVCKFFLQGNCRFGANCRNEHPSGQSGGNGGGFGTQNRFGALSNSNVNTNTNNNTNRFGGANEATKPYTLNMSEVQQDLTRGKGRPNWVLSTYGAGRGTPASLFEGNEYSPEEIRARFYEMAAKGQEAQADQEAIQLWTKAEQDLDNVSNHIDDIIKFMEEAEKKHPNRYDFLKTDGTKTREELVKAAEASNTTMTTSFENSGFGQSSSNANPFAKPAAATFGQPSQPSAFGASTFGKPAQPSGFGQPAFGQSTFGGTSSAFGQQNNPQAGGFGQSTNAPAFGQPAASSAFGKPALGASGFGQSTFGQPAQASSNSPFGQQTQTATQSPFGQVSNTPAFGASGFGQSAKPNPFAPATANAGFGASTTAFGQQPQSSPAFGQSSQPTSTFGQPSQPTSTFGQLSQPASVFGQSTQPNSGFGQTAFGKPAQPSGFGQSGFGQSAQPAGSSPFSMTATNASSGFGFGGVSATPFGQSAQQNPSPFTTTAESKAQEVSMESDVLTSSPTGPAPSSNSSNAFSMPTLTQSVPAQPAVSAASSVIASTSTPQPAASLANSSQALRDLSSIPSKPLHYTQTLPSISPQTNMSNQLSSYRGQRVQYTGDGDGAQVPCYRRPDGNGLEKIWFPEGGSAQEITVLNKEEKVLDLQATNDKYTDAVLEQFKYLLSEGKFRDGKIPLVPPMREWCAYDF